MISHQTTKSRPHLAITLSLLTASVLLAASILTLSTSSAALAQLDPAESRCHLSQDPIQEISLMLTSSGFDPAEVKPQSGRFLLSIDNRSGASELVLRLARSDGGQIRELRVPGGGGDWNEAFDLSAGTYTLSEANHSTWICTIVVP